jgi:hypothetical protein
MLSFNRAEELLGNRNKKKIANNTYLIRLDTDTIGIRLHSTDIVTILRDGKYVLNSGGYRTRTTKDRMNQYIPGMISQRKNVWYIRQYMKEAEYQDGMIIRA